MKNDKSNLNRKFWTQFTLGFLASLTISEYWKNYLQHQKGYSLQKEVNLLKKIQ